MSFSFQRLLWFLLCIEVCAAVQLFPTLKYPKSPVFLSQAAQIMGCSVCAVIHTKSFAAMVIFLAIREYPFGGEALREVVKKRQKEK